MLVFPCLIWSQDNFKCPKAGDFLWLRFLGAPYNLKHTTDLALVSLWEEEDESESHISASAALLSPLQLKGRTATATTTLLCMSHLAFPSTGDWASLTYHCAYKRTVCQKDLHQFPVWNRFSHLSSMDTTAAHRASQKCQISSASCFQPQRNWRYFTC